MLGLDLAAGPNNMFMFFLLHAMFPMIVPKRLLRSNTPYRMSIDGLNQQYRFDIFDYSSEKVLFGRYTLKN